MYTNGFCFNEMIHKVQFRQVKRGSKFNKKFLTHIEKWFVQLSKRRIILLERETE